MPLPDEQVVRTVKKRKSDSIFSKPHRETSRAPSSYPPSEAFSSSGAHPATMRIIRLTYALGR